MALFGSAASGGFDPARSDLDCLVEFGPLSPARHSDNYFGLIEDLERLFGRPVELIESGPIRNPFFRDEIEKTKVVLYDAARELLKKRWKPFSKTPKLESNPGKALP